MTSASLTAYGGLVSAEFLASAPDGAQPTTTVVSADCRNFATIVSDAPHRATLLVNGKAIATGQDITSVALSPDGSRVAYAVQDSSNQWHAVIDGTATETYDNNDRARRFVFTFSPDGKHVAYVATKGGKEFVVLDARPQPSYGVVFALNYLANERRPGPWRYFQSRRHPLGLYRRDRPHPGR